MTWAVTRDGTPTALAIEPSGLTIGDRRVAWEHVGKIAFPTPFSVSMVLADSSEALALGFRAGADQRAFRDAIESIVTSGTDVDLETRRVDPNPDAVSLTTLSTVPGRTIVAHFGLVSGHSVVSRNILSDAGSDVVSLFGGPLGGIEKAIGSALEAARDDLRWQAAQMNADHVIDIALQLETVADKAQAVLIYGTAVRTQTMESDKDS
jgi:uncharacterized protein YbjQ (UPF0145 family)